MQHRIFILLCASAIALALGVGCREASAPPAATIKIGLAGVQTGSDGAIGLGMLNGSRVAIEEWNARGGVLGKKIEIVSVDDEGKPEKAVNVAKDLVGDKVDAVIGHFNSGCTMQASPIYNQNKILEITPGSTNPLVTRQGFKNLFRIVGRDDQQGSVAAKFMRETLKLDKIAILHDKTTYGEGLANEVKKNFEALGGQVPVFAGLSKDELDFRGNIGLIKSSGAQGLFWGGMYNQAGPMCVQLRDSGLKIPFVSGDGSIMPDFIATAGPSATDVYMTFFPDTESIPAAQAFNHKYQDEFKEKVSSYSIYGYEAANVLLNAIAEAGTTDADKVSAVMHAKTFDTVLGPIQFDEKGDLKKSNYILWTVRDGVFKPL